MHNEVDKFLLSHKVEIADDGFSDHVMSHLPARTVNKNALKNLWMTICIMSTILLLSFTDVLGIILTDLKAFLITLPLENDLTQWLYVIGVPLLLYWILTAYLTSITINKQ